MANANARRGTARVAASQNMQSGSDLPSARKSTHDLTRARLEPVRRSARAQNFLRGSAMANPHRAQKRHRFQLLEAVRLLVTAWKRAHRDRPERARSSHHRNPDVTAKHRSDRRELHRIALVQAYLHLARGAQRARSRVRSELRARPRRACAQRSGVGARAQPGKLAELENDQLLEDGRLTHGGRRCSDCLRSAGSSAAAAGRAACVAPAPSNPAG